MKTNTWIALGAFVFVASFAVATSFHSPNQKAATLSSTAADKALVDANKTAGPGTGGTVVQVPQKIILTAGQGLSSVLNYVDVWVGTNNLQSWIQPPLSNTFYSVVGAPTQHAMIYFKNKVWIFGGCYTTGVSNPYPCANRNSVYSSVDGGTWIQAVSNAPWSARNGHSVIVYNDGSGDALWLIGGDSGNMGSNPLNDVWKSYDGINWTLVVQNAPWSDRYEHTSVVFDNKMWVMGGDPGPTGGNNDVWYSTNGSTWTLATNAAGWTPRARQSSVVFNNKIWIFGGLSSTGPLNDIWSSADGVNWTQSIAQNYWTPRFGQTSVAFNGTMYILGGMNNNPVYYNDIWSSTNGVNWTKLVLNPFSWLKRAHHAMALVPEGFGIIDLQPVTLTWNGIGNTSPYNNNPLSTSLANNGYVYFSAEIKNPSTNLSVTIPTNTKFEIRIVNTATGLLYTTAVTTIGTPFTIAPNGTKTLTFTTPQNPNMLKIPGTYTTTLNVDANNLVSESNETNNTLTKTLIIQ